MTKIITLGLEEAATGETTIETEKVFYASIDSANVLLAADDVEHQEQYQVFIPKTDLNKQAGRLRVRATTKKDGVPVYVLTFKTKASSGGDHETSQVISEDVFQQVKLIASNGMIKDRYFFNISDRSEKWEVDVFKMSDGKVANWCKIDYEFIGKIYRDIPPFPKGFSDVIPGDTTDPEEKAFISELYEKIFLTKMV